MKEIKSTKSAADPAKCRCGCSCGSGKDALAQYNTAMTNGQNNRRH